MSRHGIHDALQAMREVLVSTHNEKWTLAIRLSESHRSGKKRSASKALPWSCEKFRCRENFVMTKKDGGKS